MNFLTVPYLLVAIQTGELSAESVRTILLTIIAVTTSGSLRLLWLMRDDVRDNKRDIGNAKDKTGLVWKFVLLQRRVARMEKRAERIDLLLSQHAKDMQQAPHHVGRRESDKLTMQIADAVLEMQQAQERELEEEAREEAEEP